MKLKMLQNAGEKGICASEADRAEWARSRVARTMLMKVIYAEEGATAIIIPLSLLYPPGISYRREYRIH